MNENRQNNKNHSSDPRGVLGQMARVLERANLLIDRELDSRGLTGLMPAHGSLLHVLFEQDGPVPIKILVENVRRVKSTVSGMVNTLEKHGYVRKTPSDRDGRVIEVELTDQGRALQKEFHSISQELIQVVYGSIPQHEQEKMMALLREIESNLDSEIRK